MATGSKARSGSVHPTVASSWTCLDSSDGSKVGKQPGSQRLKRIGSNSPLPIRTSGIDRHSSETPVRIMFDAPIRSCRTLNGAFGMARSIFWRNFRAAGGTAAPVAQLRCASRHRPSHRRQTGACIESCFTRHRRSRTHADAERRSTTSTEHRSPDRSIATG